MIRRTKPATASADSPSGSVGMGKPIGPVGRLTVRRPSKHGGYGWMRDNPDARDILYAAPVVRLLQGLPAAVDLRPQCPPVYDQGQLGSCTGNAIAGAIEFDQMKQKNPVFAPSRLFIYYNERVMEGTVNSDAGAQIRDGIKSVATLGAPPETDWPYDISKFTKRPPAKAYSDAKQDLVGSYSRVAQVLNQMQGCLADGFPFVLGITVYESFESDAVAQSGVVPMPGQNEKAIGGHAIVAVGYNSNKRVFILRNSWGTGWGMKGYFTMPFEYLLDTRLASDFWTIRSVNG